MVRDCTSHILLCVATYCSLDNVGQPCAGTEVRRGGNHDTVCPYWQHLSTDDMYARPCLCNACLRLAHRRPPQGPGSQCWHDLLQGPARLRKSGHLQRSVHELACCPHVGNIGIHSTYNEESGVSMAPCPV